MTRRMIPAAEKAQAEVDRLQRRYNAADKKHTKARKDATEAAAERDAVKVELDHAKAHPALRQDQRGQEAAETAGGAA